MYCLPGLDRARLVLRRQLSESRRLMALFPLIRFRALTLL
jgi:hypothetical protein